MKKVAINGFGRIGRLTFRHLINDPAIEVVAINDLTDNNTLAHLLKYDSVHGQFDGTVEASDHEMIVNGKKIACFSERDPGKLPWKELGVNIVLECTGIFRTAEKVQPHLDAGAEKVLISAPGKDASFQSIVIGVNENELDRSKQLFSNASCTTNCLAPLCKIVEQSWGFEQGTMTTVHAITADQNLQDAPHSDLRRARAASVNIVPTSTGAASAVGKVYPAVAGKMFAMAVRVPVITGSLVELNVIIEKEVTPEEVNQRFREASENEMKGILQYTEDPIVSSDIVRNPHSAIFDAGLTDVKGKMLKIVAWYDNEAGYSARLAQLTSML